MKLSDYFIKNTVLESDRLILRKILLSDTDDMYDYARRGDTSKYLLWSPHSSKSVTVDTVKLILKEYDAGNFHDFAVILKSNGRMIGTVGFTSFDAKNSCAELGYVINPDYHGMGIAVEAAELILNFAFCELGVHRVEVRFMKENIQSKRVAEKCGMTFEGIMRGKLLVKGVYRDIGVAAILSEEYFSVKRENIYASQNKTFFRKLFGKS